MAGFCIGLDIGFGNLKVVYGEHIGQEKFDVLPIGAGPRTDLIRSLMGEERRDGVRVLIDGEEWAAGLLPSAFETMSRVNDPRYIYSRQYKALYYAALLRSGANVVDLVVTGLPVDQYFDDETKNKLAALLVGEHKVSDTRTITVKDVKVTAQGGGADYEARATHPELLNSPKAVLLTVDPGFFSVDYLTMGHDGPKRMLSGSSKLATSVLLEETAASFGRAHGTMVTPSQLEEAVRAGKYEVLVGLKPESFKPQLDTAAAMSSERVMQEIANKFRMSQSSINGIVLCGGAHELYANAVKEAFPKLSVFTASKPVLSNAHGFFMLGSRFLKKAPNAAA